MQSQTLPETWSDSTHLLAERLLVQDWPTDLPWKAVAPETLASESHLLPVVLRLDQLDPSQREQVQQHLVMDDRSKAAPAMLISSGLSADAMARRLAQHVVVTLADDSLALLRFADPDVFMHLLWILPLPHLASICEATNRWSVPFQGTWHELEFNDRPEPAWDRLSEASSIALTNLGLVNQAVATLPEPSGVNELWRLGQLVNEWLGVAQTSFALTSAIDCVAFARHGVLIGNGFSGHPKLAPHLHAAASTPGRYANETALLCQREWNAVIADVEQSQRTREAS
jgi:hypothetical protein